MPLLGDRVCDMVIFTMKESWLIKNGGTSKKDAALESLSSNPHLNYFRVMNDM